MHALPVDLPQNWIDYVGEEVTSTYYNGKSTILSCIVGYHSFSTTVKFHTNNSRTSLLCLVVNIMRKVTCVCTYEYTV